MNNRDISFYADTLIVETILADDSLVKNAEGGIMTDLIEKAKNYFASKIVPGHETASVLSMLAPAVIKITFSAMGLGWLGWLLGIAAATFQIDVEGMLASIYDHIKSALGDGKPISSSVVDTATSTAISTYAPQNEGLTKTESFKQQLKAARKLKLAMVAYANDSSEFQFSKYAVKAQLTKAVTGSILGKLIGWIFKVALASAGLLVAGDLVREYILGKPSSLSGGVQKGKEVDNVQPIITSTQTKFKPNPGADAKYNISEPWSITGQANQSNIETLLLNFAKQVYQGLDGLDNIIRSTAGFQVVRDEILDKNRSNSGYNEIIIPKAFTSKKQIVDTFIDEVAKNSP